MLAGNIVQNRPSHCRLPGRLGELAPGVSDPATNTWAHLTSSTLTSPLYRNLPALRRALDRRWTDPTTRTISRADPAELNLSPFDGMSAVVATDKIEVGALS